MLRFNDTHVRAKKEARPSCALAVRNAFRYKDVDTENKGSSRALVTSDQVDRLRDKDYDWEQKRDIS